MRIGLGLLLSSVLTSGALAAAPPKPDPGPASGDEIVVEGKLIPRAEASRAAAQMLRGQLYTPEFGQYARFLNPVCPKVLGLAPEIAKLVESRIRSVAADAGAPIARTRCRTNLLVAFAADGRDLMRQVARTNRRRLFLDTRPFESEPVLNSDLPVRWVYRISVDPSELGNRDSPALAGATGGAGVLPFGFENTFVSTSNYGSVINTPVAFGIGFSLVVVDVNRAAGHPLDSVAAYAARVGLAQTRMPPPRPGEATSIMTLFDDPKTPDIARSLTDWDRSLLRGLYTVAPNMEAWKQRGLIHGRMMGTLAEGREVPNPNPEQPAS